MRARLRWVWDETAPGLAFNAAIAVVGSLGHVHREPSWQLARLATTPVLAIALALSLASLVSPTRYSKAVSWLVRPATILGVLGLGAGVLALGAATAEKGVNAFTLTAQAQSQWNLWLQSAFVVSFWPALSSTGLRAERADRRGLVFNMVILLVVIQAALHAARMYRFSDDGPLSSALASSMAWFVIVSVLSSFFAWFLTRDSVAASLNKGALAPPVIGEPQARVVYAKLGLVEGLSPQTYAYARQNREFPQQSTADQFFDDAQLEAYLEIGQRMGEAIATKFTAPAARP